MSNSKRLIANSAILFSCLTLSACLAPAHKPRKTIALQDTTQLKLEIEVDASSPPSARLNDEVIKNLNEWHYPLATASNSTYSHILSARVGKIKPSSSPSGLSFSSGNSDPRSLDFQKADVLPVSCALKAKRDEALIDDLSMGFTATEMDRRALAPSKLAEHISTVCFNLLRSVKWPIQPEKAAEAQSVQPQWMPEIRIETKTVPAKAAVNAKVPVDAKVPADAKKADSPSPQATTPPDNTVIIEEDSKQEMIIHNQGTPVILNFGYDRPY